MSGVMRGGCLQELPSLGCSISQAQMAADSFPTQGRVSSLSSLCLPCLQPHQSLRVTREMNQQRMEPECEQR